MHVSTCTCTCSLFMNCFRRFGSFEIFKTRDRVTGRVGPSVGWVDILHQLLDYVTKTFYPEVRHVYMNMYLQSLHLKYRFMLLTVRTGWLALQPSLKRCVWELPDWWRCGSLWDSAMGKCWALTLWQYVRTDMVRLTDTYILYILCICKQICR